MYITVEYKLSDSTTKTLVFTDTDFARHMGTEWQLASRLLKIKFIQDKLRTRTDRFSEFTYLMQADFN